MPVLRLFLIPRCLCCLVSALQQLVLQNCNQKDIAPAAIVYASQAVSPQPLPVKHGGYWRVGQQGSFIKVGGGHTGWHKVGVTGTAPL